MKIFLGLLILLFSLNGISQDWASANAKSMVAYEKGQYQKAIDLANQSLTLAVQSFGTISNEYLISLSNRGYAESGIGNYTRALSTFKNAANISFELHPLPHVTQIETLGELAKIQMEMSVFDSAAYYINFARYIYIEVPKKNKAHYDSSTYLLTSAYFKINNLDASLHKELGQLNQALIILRDQVDMMQAFYPDDYKTLHDYQVTINNLANYSIGDLAFEDAKEYSLEYYGLIKNNNDDLDMIHALQNIGSVYRHLEVFDSAISYWNTALNLIESSGYEETYIHTALLNNFGEFYISLEQYEPGIKYLNTSLEIQRRKADLNPELYRTTLFNLAVGYRWSEAYAKADLIYNNLIAELLDNIIHNFTYLSDNEKLSFYKNQLSILEDYTSFALEVSGIIPIQKSDTPYINPEIAGKLYDLQLTTKAVILNASKRMKNNILTSGDSTLVYIYSLWEERKNQLAQKLLSETEATDEIKQLKEKIEENEKWLTNNSRSFRAGFNFQPFSWKEVQQTLQPGEAAVEIIRLVNGLVYGALIITPETKEQPLFSLVMSTRSKHLEKQYYFYYQNSILQKSTDTISYAKYWKPIIDSIKTKMGGAMPNRVYVSNDGIYNQINLNTLYDAAQQNYVLDQTEIVILDNTRDLLNQKKKISASQKQAVLFGKPSFSMQRDHDGKFVDLPGTGKEVNLIDETLLAAKWNTIVYTEESATETNLKKLSNMNVLHLASHGFFDPQTRDESTSIAETMIRSGIALAGVNDSIKQMDDGLLTAYEVISLNLDSTVLVVLSACETGKGVTNNGDGVYGLQRALHVAGAENIIMSLWKVDDQATQKLMVNFYKHWIKTNNMRKAFETAQKELRKEYPQPYYWGAFILTGK